METKKDQTKELLADCFHQLMMKTPFDKITIKMITDKAGLIRPTFYKHFQDKYEILEWIFKTDVTDSVDLMLANGMELDAIVMFCRCLERDRKFYKRAYAMEPGPNSFDAILTRYVYNTFLTLAKRYKFRSDSKYPFLTTERIAIYYTYGLVNTVRDWISSGAEASADEVADGFKYLLSHSVLDLVTLDPE